jgi:hypothetical protein
VVDLLLLPTLLLMLDRDVRTEQTVIAKEMTHEVLAAK